ncbi:MAG: universal stress protein [Bacteroidota bacterium]
MKTPSTILVPIDMSAFSVTALVYAQEIAPLFEADVIVVHVVEKDEPAAQAAGGPKGAATQDEIDARVKSALFHLLLDHNVVHQTLKCEVRHGAPVREIVKAAKDVHADLIVMSTHGRSGLSHVLLGSVAEKVVRFAPCPVLTVKPEEFRELVDVREEDIQGSLHLS